MGAKENLQKLVDRKQQEVRELEVRLEHARIYIQALQDSIKALPREIVASEQSEATELRAGTLLHKAKEALSKRGQPMHVNFLLAEIGVANTKQARVSLVGSLGTYVRRGLVFTRPGPNVFGLVGMAKDEKHWNGETGASQPNLPEGFGGLTDFGEPQ